MVAAVADMAGMAGQYTYSLKVWAPGLLRIVALRMDWMFVVEAEETLIMTFVRVWWW